MREWVLTKTLHGYVPADEYTVERDAKIKFGRSIHAPFREMRNAGFHRKFFALLNYAFDLWEPGEINSKYGKPEKNFERFREDCIILAGFFHLTIRLDGTERIEADSISFANMSQETFEHLYSNVLDVLIKRIKQMADMGEEEVNRVVNELISFG